MADIFISYSHRDRPFAAALYEELRRFKVRGFMDRTDLAAGADWGRELRDAIRNADALVVVLSRAAAESSTVLAELGVAQGMEKRVVPVLAPGERYEAAVPPQLLDRLVIDAQDIPIEEVAARVVAAATNTSVDAALQQVRSRARQRQRRLLLVAAALGLLAASTSFLAVLAQRERDAAISAQREAEDARERIAALSSQGAFALAPDGKTAAVGGREGVVYLLDIPSGRPVGRLSVGAGAVNSLAYAPDGRMVAIAASGGIQIWDLASQRRVADLRGHSDLVLGVQFSPDGRTLVSRSLDGTLRVWDLITGQQLESVPVPR